MAGRPGHAAYQLFRFRSQRLGLGNPGISAARKTDLFTDLVRGIVVELGELPVVENTEVVELLLDRTRHAGKLLEVVGGAARTGQPLEAMRRVYRHLESMWDAFGDSGIKIQDHDGEAVPEGGIYALNVIAFQPTAGLERQQVIETIKPTIYYKERMIQRGEVIVGTPVLAEP